MSYYPEKRNGVLTGRWRVEVQKDGKRLPVKVVDTKKEAKRLDREMQLGVVVEAPKGYTVDDLWADCKGHWEGGKDPQGLRRFEIACEVLKKALGKTPLPEIKLDHMDEFLKLILARPGVDSKQTANRYLSPISYALSWADEREKIKRKPNMKALWASIPKNPKFSLSEEDMAKQREALQDQRGADYVLLMDVQIATGTRISELLKLTPKDITHEDQWTRLQLLDTKAGGYRYVSIPLDLGKPFGAMVEAGLPHYSSILRAMKFARKTAGLPMTQPTHAHRHTAATRMTALGVSVPVVQEMLGHSSPTTTMLYIDVNEKQKRDAVLTLLGRETHGRS